MKFLLTLAAVSTFTVTALADHYRRGEDDALLITTTGVIAYTISQEHYRRHHSLMVEAAPVAANYLTSGQGLDNPALVAAMISVQNGDTSLTTEELALLVIEEANK